MALSRMAVYSAVVVLVLALSYVSGDIGVQLRRKPDFNDFRLENGQRSLEENEGLLNELDSPQRRRLMCDFFEICKRIRRSNVAVPRLLQPLPEEPIRELSQKIQAEMRRSLRSTNARQWRDLEIMNAKTNEKDVEA